MIRMTKLAHLLLLLLCLCLPASKASPSSLRNLGEWPRKPVTVHVFNDSGSHLYTRWINHETGEKSELHENADPLYSDSTIMYQAYTFDRFEIYKAECLGKETAEDHPECPHISLTLAGPEHMTETDGDQTEVQMYRIDDKFRIHPVKNTLAIQQTLQQNPLKTTLHIDNVSNDIFVDLYYMDPDEGPVKLTRRGPMAPQKTEIAKSKVAVATNRGDEFQLKQTYPCEDPYCPSINVKVPFGTKNEPRIVIEDKFKISFVH